MQGVQLGAARVKIRSANTLILDGNNYREVIDVEKQLQSWLIHQLVHY